jgi:hypothetical protein
MAYTTEQYDADKEALDAAQSVLSALVVGEKNEACAQYGEDFARMAQYFDGLAVRRVLRTFLTIAQSPKISGMECGEFARTLGDVDRMIKSKRKFFRKPAKKCFSPMTHGKGCCCARLAAAKAKLEVTDEAKPLKASLVESNSLEGEEKRLREALRAAI